ncbi:hypothetical protein AeMF1_007559, partial [Aphanomyces euteiches]
MPSTASNASTLPTHEANRATSRSYSRKTLIAMGVVIATTCSVAAVGSAFPSAHMTRSLRELTDLPSLARIAWNEANKLSAIKWLTGELATGTSYLAMKQKALFEVAIQDTIAITVADDEANVDKNSRTYSGAHNNIKGCPFMGARGQPFTRNTFAVQNPNLTYPLPDDVANVLFNRTTFQPATIINMWVPAWIQFVVHDLLDHTQDYNAPQLRIGSQTLYKTQSVPGSPNVYANRLDHFLDGSSVYGSVKLNGTLLRLPDGSLSLPDDYLPLDGNMEALGVPKNIWFGLSMITYIMAKEHNALVAMFHKQYPKWSGDECFEKARLVISALVAKIQGLEWTEAIIQNKIGQYAQDHLFYGLLGKASRKLFGTQKWLGNFVCGIWGGNLEYRGVKYATSEEFVSVYRMHSLLPDDFTVRSFKDNSDLLKFGLKDAIFEGSHKINTNVSRLDMVYSMGTSYPGALVLNNFPNALRSFQPTDYNHTIDLAAVDIIRDRERAVPRYNAFRRSLLLTPIKTWNDLTSDKDVIQKLQKVYGNDVELLDLLVGTSAEEKLPGFVFGETIYTVFVAQTQRRIES